MDDLNVLYDSLGLHKWWAEPLPENSIIEELPVVATADRASGSCAYR